MQRRYELKDIDQWLFSQVRPFDPKKVKVNKLNAAAASAFSAASAGETGNNADSSNSEEIKDQDTAAMIRNHNQKVLLERIAKYKADNADLQEPNNDVEQAQTAELAAQNDSNTNATAD